MFSVAPKSNFREVLAFCRSRHETHVTVNLIIIIAVTLVTTGQRYFFRYGVRLLS